jgi:hypothetical protein
MLLLSFFYFLPPHPSLPGTGIILSILPSHKIWKQHLFWKALSISDNHNWIICIFTLLAAWWNLWSEDFQILCVSLGRIHGRTHECKWSLLKVREGKYKRKHGGSQIESGERECASLLHVLLKLTLTYREWRGTWVAPWPGEGGPAVPGWGVSNLHTHTILSNIFFVSPKLSLILACINLINWAQ